MGKISGKPHWDWKMHHKMIKFEVNRWANHTPFRTHTRCAYWLHFIGMNRSNIQCCETNVIQEKGLWYLKICHLFYKSPSHSYIFNISHTIEVSLHWDLMHILHGINVEIYLLDSFNIFENFNLSKFSSQHTHISEIPYQKTGHFTSFKKKEHASATQYLQIRT